MKTITINNRKIELYKEEIIYEFNNITIYNKIFFYIVEELILGMRLYTKTIDKKYVESLINH